MENIETMEAEHTEQPNNEDSQHDIDMYGDGFSEADINAMFDDVEESGGEGVEPEGEEQQGDAPKEEQEAQKPEEQKEESEDDAPSSYELEVFGRKAQLSGDQITELVEAGAQFMQHKPGLEKAAALFTAVQRDPQLQAILYAYANGQPLPNAAHAEPVAADPNDPVAAFRAQLMAEIAPALRSQIIGELQEHYKPFVDNVERFAAEHRTEKAFAEVRKDVDYEAVNALMRHNIVAKVQEGAITYQQAAQIEHALQHDPAFYKEWFGKFKAVVQKGKQDASASPVTAANVKTVNRAPKLESSAQVGDTLTKNEQLRRAMDSAINGNDEAMNYLFDNQ